MNQGDYFKNQLLKTIRQLVDDSVMEENLKFVILPSNAENERPRNNWDEIINLWVLPTSTEIKLTLTQVIDTLCSRQGLIPLWVKVKAYDNDLILLNISRRFRKLKEIREYHKDNENMPCLYEDSSELTFTNELERIGIIRKLLWQFDLAPSEKKIFENDPLTFNEVKLVLEKHFESYNYFPPNYNHRVIGNKGYSKLVIKMESGNEFLIVDNIGTILESIIMKSTSFDKILDFYFQKERAYTIADLVIKKY